VKGLKRNKTTQKEEYKSVREMRDGRKKKIKKKDIP
jgi:hypothetical protein